MKTAAAPRQSRWAGALHVKYRANLPHCVATCAETWVRRFVVVTAVGVEVFRPAARSSAGGGGGTPVRIARGRGHEGVGRGLTQLGAVQLLAPGLGDDQHDLGPDFVIDSWLESFWRLALQLYPLPPGKQPISTSAGDENVWAASAPLLPAVSSELNQQLHASRRPTPPARRGWSSLPMSPSRRPHGGRE